MGAACEIGHHASTSSPPRSRPQNDGAKCRDNETGHDRKQPEIEAPFGVQPNDLALDAVSATIEATLREMMGEAQPPSLDVEPTDFIQT